MMKKLVSAVLAVAWLIGLFLANSNQDVAVTRDWPLGLGPLDAVAARYPVQKTNEAAHELERLAADAGINFKRQPGAPTDPITDYVRAQFQKTDRSIDPAPPLPANVPAIRTHLLSGGPIVWEIDLTKAANAPMPNLLAHVRVSRLLISSAFDRARRGEAGAWDDLHASWELSRGLWRRPELASAVVALSIDRWILAAARKMPHRVPAWFNEMRSFDYRKSMMAAMQADSWLIGTTIREIQETDDAEGNWITRTANKTVMAPYLALSRADLLAHQRESAHELAKVTACGFDAEKFSKERMDAVPFWNLPAKVAIPNIHSIWQRVFRVRAELELTEHALGLRSGARSQCTDGQWVFDAAGVRFSKLIRVPGPANTSIPLKITR